MADGIKYDGSTKNLIFTVDGNEKLRLSGSLTDGMTISGNLNTTGSLTNIYNGPPQWDGVLPEKYINLSLGTGSALFDYGSMILYGWSGSTSPAHEIDLYGGIEGGVYSAAGPVIGPSGTDGVGSYNDYGEIWQMVYYADGFKVAEIQNVANNGDIRIGTVSKVNTTSSIYIGSDIGQNGQKNVVIGNNVSGSKVYINGPMVYNAPFVNQISISGTENYGSMEIGGPSGSFIDLKSPYTEDYDLRLFADLDLLPNTSGMHNSLYCGVYISGSTTTISGAFKLEPQSTLPSGTLGLLSVSGSNLYFHDGSNWRQVSLI